MTFMLQSLGGLVCVYLVGVFVLLLAHSRHGERKTRSCPTGCRPRGDGPGTLPSMREPANERLLTRGASPQETSVEGRLSHTRPEKDQ